MTGAPTELKVTFASEITPRRQKWFYAPSDQGTIPIGTGTVFAGIGGEGKSSFALHLAALLSRGELEGDLYGVKGTTIIFGPEDPWESVMVPRLMAAGADRSRIAKITAESLTPYGVQERELKFPLDIERLEQQVHKLGVKLIIVDPISTAMTGDLNKVQDVREALSALTGLAEKYDLTVIAINHFNKSGTSVSSKMSGSHAIRDVVRSYLAFATDDETGERIITQDKNNYGTGFGSWKFVLHNNLIEIPGETKLAEVPSVQILGSSDVTVSDLLDREHGQEDDDRHEADRWVIEMLTEAGGSMAVKEIRTAAAAAGFNFKTLQNRRAKIRNPRVVTGRNGYGKNSVPFWQIEEETQVGPTYLPVPKTPGSMGSMGNGPGSKGIHPIDPVHPEHKAAPGATGTNEDDLLSQGAKNSVSTPSTGAGICWQHGTNYKISTCKTCLALAEQAS